MCEQCANSVLTPLPPVSTPAVLTPPILCEHLPLAPLSRLNVDTQALAAAHAAPQAHHVEALLSAACDGACPSAPVRGPHSARSAARATARQPAARCAQHCPLRAAAPQTHRSGECIIRGGYNPQPQVGSHLRLHCSFACPRWGTPRASLQPPGAPGGDITVMPEVFLTPPLPRATVHYT